VRGGADEAPQILGSAPDRHRDLAPPVGGARDPESKRSLRVGPGPAEPQPLLRDARDVASLKAILR
jgi:hypothetical protein